MTGATPFFGNSGNLRPQRRADVLVEVGKSWSAGQALGPVMSLVCALGLAGCSYGAPYTEQVYDGPKRDPKDVAILRETNIFSARITHIDYVDVADLTNREGVATFTYELLPGRYVIGYEAYGTYRGPTATGTAKLELLAGRTYTVKGLAQSPYWKQYHQTAAYIVDGTSDDVIACANVRRYSGLGCGSSNSIFLNIPRAMCEGRMPCEIVDPSPRKSDKFVCRLAVAMADGAPHWNEGSALPAHIDEAKRRGLTPEKCVALLGREQTHDEPRHRPATQAHGRVQDVARSHAVRPARIHPGAGEIHGFSARLPDRARSEDLRRDQLPARPAHATAKSSQLHPMGVVAGQIRAIQITTRRLPSEPVAAA